MSTEKPDFEDRLLDDLAGEDPGPQHMAAMLAGAQERLHASDRCRRQMQRSALVGGLAAAIVVALLVVPMSYEVEVGNRVQAVWSAPTTDIAELEILLGEIDGLAARKFGFRDDSVHATLVFVGSSSAVSMAAVREVLTAYLPPHIVPTIESTAIERRHGGNALAALSNGYVKVLARGLSDEEVEQAIVEELSLIGIRGTEAEITNLPDGAKQIDVQMQESPYDSITFEVTF